MSEKIKKNGSRKGVDKVSVFIHLTLAVFGVMAFLTGDWADDYKKAVHDGFDQHGWLGITVASIVAVRLIYGLAGPESARYLRWFPFTLERLRKAGNGLYGAISLKTPDRESHRYISGIVKSFGLILFSWMAMTGTLMFFFLEPGGRATGFIHQVKEMHEVGESMIPLYLTLHIGVIIIHAFYKRHIWKPMVFAG